MKYLFLLFAVLLSGCMQGHNMSVRIVDQDFEPFIADFKTAARENNINLKIDNLVMMLSSDEDFNSNELGLCTVNFDYKTNTIRIKKSIWGRLDYWNKRQLVFHELGHCVLHIYKHIDDVDCDKKPISIMNTWNIGGLYNAETHQKYDKELFKESKL